MRRLARRHPLPLSILRSLSCFFVRGSDAPRRGAWPLLRNRLLSLSSGMNRHGGDGPAQRHSGDRDLQSIDSPEACYAYCSLNAKEKSPSSSTGIPQQVNASPAAQCARLSSSIRITMYTRFSCPRLQCLRLCLRAP